MAPTSTSSGTPTALPINTQPAPPSGFSGDNFINNLGSDLAPLLTLFGEQVTKQFLTMSLGWADNILLAVGPLGIITIIVSAIRVGRVRILKALIGRARESSNLAEVELLSSTSDNSSEIWTYEGVVRLPGKAPVLELIVYGNSEASNPNDVQVGDLGNAYDDDVLEFLPKHVDIQHGIDVSRLSQRLAQQPPNITLNIDKTITSHQETWSFAAFGVALQTVALVIPGIMTYHWKEEKDGGLVQDYAYPTFLVGSLALIIGIALCSHIIEATSVEHMFKLKRPNVKNVMYLQMACTMGDQTFKPYLLIMGHEKDCIRTSRSDGYIAHESPVWFAVVICLLGFVGQFVGLRALHWSATVVQLGVTLIMTATRAWIRRGISRPPEAIPITSTDLDWIALKVGRACQLKESQSSDTDSFAPYTCDNRYRTIEHLWYTRGSISRTKEITIRDPCIDVRRKIHDLSPVGSDYNGLLLRLQITTGSLCQKFARCRPWRRIESQTLTWLHLIHNLPTDSPVSFSMLRLFQDSREDSNTDAAMITRHRMHALLTLCIYGFKRHYNHDIAIFGMSQERKWKESYRGPQPVCLLALFRYPVHVQCALDIISGCIDAIVKQILQLSLEGKRLTITEIVDLAEDLSELILKHGPVALKSEAMMLVYPTFLREGLLPPVPPERGGQSTSDASSGSGDNHDANRTGPNTESIKSTNISDHSSTGISLNTESSQNTAEAGPSSGDHTNTSDAQSSLDNNHNTSDDVSSPPSPIPQQTNPNPREPSPHPTSIPLTPQQHP
ncbi:hypothetical protein HRS9139_09262 [Pyrenophora teres f. teres]|uniref:Ankyrin repeat protein n=1 Tax=Pyrenophora teres f. teres TaxID=97479 RepID=A0A6S6WEC8_9PLEO|nr:hypothetical protein HRS9139_09262 [Pyrenophora teres f. teres]KAE8855137.1 hypothetical protein PTNB29_09388 [Pyrenophora teres f. teres]CAE7211465.1 Ankyrin repeat protein [Pyrenophora teres f. teres]